MHVNALSIIIVSHIHIDNAHAQVFLLAINVVYCNKNEAKFHRYNNDALVMGKRLMMSRSCAFFFYSFELELQERINEKKKIWINYILL